MIIVTGHEKGGTGKTTIATSLAVWLAQRGRTPLLIDADNQMSRSSTSWARRREELGVTPLITLVQGTGDLRYTLGQMSKRFSDVIVDCGGQDSMEMRSALSLANWFLVPVRPAQLDLWPLTRVAELARGAAALNRSLVAAVIFNFVSTHPKVRESERAREVLLHKEFAGLSALDSELHQRQRFATAPIDGRTALEMDDARARSELQALATEVFR